MVALLTASFMAVAASAGCDSSESTAAVSPGGGALATGGNTGTGGAGATAGTGGFGPGGGAGGGHGGSATTSRFPLTLTAGERFLREADGSPFFFHGDTGWSLLAQLDAAQAEQYLENRRAKGFTVVLVNLLEHRFADEAPSNAYGEPPFTTAGDYATPNEAYFAHVDAVLGAAAERGLLVLLTPSYVGYGGGDEGFYQEMVANGTTKLEAYGRFLGARYSSHPNILWLHAGDYDPPNQDLVHAIANGIRAEDAVHLHSAHTSRGEAASDVWGAASWLEVDNVYTDADAYGPSLALCGTTTRPFFLIEAYYEGEHTMTEAAIRGQAYGPLLAGAMGQIFGNNPIWCFGAETCLGTTAPPTTWQAALDARGSRDMQVLAQIFGAVAWEHLVPDAALLVSNDADAIAARADDASFALLYTRALGSVEIDLGAFATAVRVERIDPTSGAVTTVVASPLNPSGSYVVPVDTLNATGTTDWVLRLAP